MDGEPIPFSIQYPRSGHTRLLHGLDPCSWIRGQSKSNPSKVLPIIASSLFWLSQWSLNFFWMEQAASRRFSSKASAALSGSPDPGGADPGGAEGLLLSREETRGPAFCATVGLLQRAMPLSSLRMRTCRKSSSEWAPPPARFTFDLTSSAVCSVCLCVERRGGGEAIFGCT